MNQDDDYHEPPEPCYIIEGEWANENEDTDERTMGREVSTKDN